MTLRNNIIIATTLFSFIALSCVRNKSAKTSKSIWSDTTNLSVEERTQRKVWADFKKAVTTMDVDGFKNLTMSYIYYPDSYSYLSNKQADTSDTKYYILTETFVSNGGFQSVFNKKANEFYFNYANVGWMHISNASDLNLEDYPELSKLTGRKFFEISINNGDCSGAECSQTIFSFVDTDKGYKFFGMTNIP